MSKPVETVAPTEESVSLRCPVGAKRLLAMVVRTGEPPTMVDGNLLELACRDCKARTKNSDGQRPKIVKHRFNAVGDLVSTIEVWN